MLSQICRICGHLTNNYLNIFDANIVDEITTVYPILLYKNDPFSQYICKKCHSKAFNIYASIRDVVEKHHLMICKLRISKPNDTYIKMLDQIEHGKSLVRNDTHDPFLSKIIEKCLERLARTQIAPIKTTYKEESTDIEDNQQSKKPLKTYSRKTNSTPGSSSSDAKKVPAISTEIKSDGKELSAITLQSPSVNSDNCYKNNSDEEETTPLAMLASSSVNKCNHCSHSFKSLEELFQHNEKHLRIRVFNVFPKKQLQSSERRGRVSNIDNKNYIRCLCCHREFEGKRQILSHWDEGNCEYYCLICGAQFKNAPNALRVHVNEVHTTNYDNLIQLYSKYKTTQPNHNHICKVCLRSFETAESYGVHMRLHESKKVNQAKDVSTDLVKGKNEETTLGEISKSKTGTTIKKDEIKASTSQPNSQTVNIKDDVMTLIAKPNNSTEVNKTKLGNELPILIVAKAKNYNKQCDLSNAVVTTTPQNSSDVSSSDVSSSGNSTTQHAASNKVNPLTISTKISSEISSSHSNTLQAAGNNNPRLHLLTINDKVVRVIYKPRSSLDIKLANNQPKSNESETPQLNVISPQRTSGVRGIRMKFVQPRNVSQQSNVEIATTSKATAISNTVTSTVMPVTIPKTMNIKKIATPASSAAESPHILPLASVATPTTTANVYPTVPKIKVKSLSELQRSFSKRAASPSPANEASTFKRPRDDFMDLTLD